MLRSKVQRSNPILFLLCIFGCSNALENLSGHPRETTFTLRNTLSQSIFIEVGDLQSPHFVNIIDPTGAPVTRFQNSCFNVCGQPRSECKASPSLPAIREIKAGETFTETWDSSVWKLIEDNQNQLCSQQTFASDLPHTAQFCWSYARVNEALDSQVCAQRRFIPGQSEVVEQTVVDAPAQPITFELENQAARDIDIYQTTGCGGAAGWVIVRDPSGAIVQREYDCSFCLCGNTCAICDCAGPIISTLSPGQVATERWDGIFLAPDATSEHCLEPAVAHGSFTADFCWSVGETPTRCQSMQFTLGSDTTLRFVIP